MPAVRNIVVDRNESLLGRTTITRVPDRLFGAPGAARRWFQERTDRFAIALALAS
jgi:hypothetical protein